MRSQNRIVSFYKLYISKDTINFNYVVSSKTCGIILKKKERRGSFSLFHKLAKTTEKELPTT